MHLRQGKSPSRGRALSLSLLPATTREASRRTVLFSLSIRKSPPVPAVDNVAIVVAETGPRQICAPSTPRIVMMQKKKRSRDAGGAHDNDNECIYDVDDFGSTPSRHGHGTSSISGGAGKYSSVSNSLHRIEGDGGHLRPRAQVREERRWTPWPSTLTL